MGNFKSMGSRHIDGFRRTPRSPYQRGNVNAKLEEFKSQQPGVWAWLNEVSEKNAFASSLKEQLLVRGALSEKQVGAAHNAMARALIAEGQKAASEALAPSVGEGAIKIIQVFQRARANGYKRPTVRTSVFDFTFAPETGRNPGWLYVKDHDSGNYLGKIDPTGRYYGSLAEQSLAMLMQVIENPLEAAVKFGAQTGVCSCCGRELTNKESVELGIGPICREKFFGP
jgi:hypothetical protein